ncbi:MAG: hypothetical protein HOV87_12045 [Catenulispora sp.]|nr:hypothetical protein [Catenulispora sp.]NUT40019.1 hypothetical protein [Thermoactinospora sp.]
MKVIHLTEEHPEYGRYAAMLCEEPLRTQWWMDAESGHEEGTSYLMVLDVDASGAYVPAAWAGYAFERLDETEAMFQALPREMRKLARLPILRCRDNYVAHGFRDRDPERYETAYAARHQLVVSPWQGLAYTYLYDPPKTRHERDGWFADPNSDLGHGFSSPDATSGIVHEWWRLFRCGI